MARTGDQEIPEGLEGFFLDPDQFDTEEEYEEALYQRMLANRDD